MLAPVRVLSLMPIMSWNTAKCCDGINPTLTHIKTNKWTKMMTDMNMEAIFEVMNTPWAVVKIRPEKKFRPVRNNKNNSILAKFATYDGFMVKKKKFAFLNLSSRRSKMPTLFAEFHLKKKTKSTGRLQNVSVKHRYNNTQPCFPTNWHHIEEAVYGFSNIPAASPLNNLFSLMRSFTSDSELRLVHILLHKSHVSRFIHQNWKEPVIHRRKWKESIHRGYRQC